MSAGYRVTIVLDVYAHGCYRASVYETSVRYAHLGARYLVSEYTLGYHGVRGACPAERAS